MKRLIAVGIVAGVLLATSTAAFAVPTTVTQSGDVLFDQTLTEGFTYSHSPGYVNYRITWFQPFDAATIPAADFSAYPAGGTLSGPDVDITSAVLTLLVDGVNEGVIEPVWRGTSTSDWVAQIGTLEDSDPAGNIPSTTVITLADADAWLAPTGFYVQIRSQDGNQDDELLSSRLQVTTHWSYTYTYDDGTVPPVPAVPAPGAILLASMGAGLISWLRARRSL